jgi:hypothetical protein
VLHLDPKNFDRRKIKHLLEQAAVRFLKYKSDDTLLDLATFHYWLHSRPPVPSGPWCADFGSFVIPGHGVQISTALEPELPQSIKEIHVHPDRQYMTCTGEKLKIPVALRRQAAEALKAMRDGGGDQGFFKFN